MRRKRHVCRSKGADAKLLRILELACQKIIGPTTPKGQDLVRKVRQLIVERLPKGSANIDAIADELNMSSKTLERRLAERGQSFSALLDADAMQSGQALSGGDRHAPLPGGLHGRLH